jgi:hypothetical protein
MCYDYQCCSGLFIEVKKQLDYFFAGFGIKVSGWFVGKKDLRFVRKCPGKRNALLFAAAELGRVVVASF